MKIKSASSNPRVKSLNPRVTTSNPRVTSSNPWVTGSNPRAASSNPPTIKSMKMQVNSFKSSLLDITISPKFFHNSHLYVQFLVIISCFSFPLLHGYSFEWVNINFKRRDLNSPNKNHPPKDDFGKICFFLCF